MQSNESVHLLVLGRDSAGEREPGGGAVRPLANVSPRDAAEAFSALSAPRRARIAVASAEVFSDRVRLSAGRIAGLSREHLRSALAFELEPFSGVPAADAAVAFTEVPDPDPAFTAFDAAVLPRGRLSELGDAARAAGFSLACVTPLPPSGAADISGLPQIVPSGKRGAAPTFAGKLCTTSIAALALCAAAIAGPAVIRSKLSHEAQERAALGAELGARAAGTAAMRRRAAELLAEKAARDAAASRLGAMRAAWPELLERLARSCAGGAMIDSLAADGGAFELRCVCADAAEATAAAVRFSEALAACGWSVKPGAVSERAPGGPVACSFRLVSAPEAADD